MIIRWDSDFNLDGMIVLCWVELWCDYPDYPASPRMVAAKLYILVHFVFRQFILICFLWISWHSPDF